MTTGNTGERDALRAAGFRKLLDAMLGGGSAGSAGQAVAEARDLIADAKPADLVRAVDSAVADGIDLAPLKPAVSKLVNLLSAPLSRHRHAPTAGDALFGSLMAENAGLARVLERGKSAARALNDPNAGTAGVASALSSLRRMAEELKAVDIHYRKKENVLFPYFESRYPRYRCVRLMWEIQDDARKGLRDLEALLGRAADIGAINKALGRLYFDLNANVTREECALFPVMAGLLARAEADALFRQCDDYGYAFLGAEAAAAFRMALPSAGAEAMAPSAAVASGQPAFSGRTGALSAEVLSAMFAAVPLDMTFVGADDAVAWFSDSPRRIFPRSPAIIGRDVRNCHPGASVGRVVAILDAFRSGAKDREAFWLELGGRFVHIEYFALRAPDGSYLGTLECSQDLTGLRALTGEKRLVDPAT